MAVVRVRLGVLSGVAAEALRFCFDVAAAGTPLDGADLVIEAVPVSAHCPACEAVVILTDPTRLACPACGSPTADVRGGRELEVVSLTCGRPTGSVP